MGHAAGGNGANGAVEGAGLAPRGHGIAQARRGRWRGAWVAFFLAAAATAQAQVGPDLSVSGFGFTPATVSVGGKATVSATVSNQSLSVGATDVKFRAYLPSVVSFVAGSGAANGGAAGSLSCTPVSRPANAAVSALCASAQTIECSLGALAVGASQSVQLQVSGATPGNLPACAEVVSSVTDDYPADNDGGVQNITVESPDLAIKLVQASSGRPTIGSKFTVAVEAANLNFTNAEGVQITISPAAAASQNLAIQFLQKVSVADPGGFGRTLYSGGVSCSARAGTATVDCVLTPTSSLPGNQRVFFGLEFQADSTDRAATTRNLQITSSVSCGNSGAACAEASSDLGNNQAIDDFTIYPSADLQITKTASKTPVTVSEPFSYTLAVANNGPSNAPNVVVRDALDPALELLAGYDSSCTPSTSSSTGQTTVTCAFSLNNGASRNLTLPVRVKLGSTLTTLSNTATVNHDTSGGKPQVVDGNTSNNQSTTTVTVQASRLAGYVYVDSNLDGARGTSEGLAGLDVCLSGTDAYGNTIGAGCSLKVTPGADGSFSFPGLPPGNYTLTRAADSNYFESRAIVPSGAPGAVSSPSSIGSIALTAGADLPNYLFELLRKYSVSGYVFEDKNGNNVRDASGDPGLPNIQVTLTGTSFSGAAVSLSTNTGADGSYAFNNVPPPSAGTTYQLREPTQPPGYNDGYEQNGSSGGVVSGSNRSDVITLAVADFAASQALTDRNFGELKQIFSLDAGLSLVVCFDKDNSGTCDPTDAGIAGVTITLVGPSGTRTVTTDSSGRYDFGPLPVGTYTVTETQPAGYLDVKPPICAHNVLDTCNATGQNQFTVVVTSSFAGASLQFPEMKGSTVSGTVYQDANNSRTADSGEGLPGVTVRLVNLDTGAVATVTTDANGRYEFPSLPPGSYAVEENQPAGLGDVDAISGSGCGGTVASANRIQGIVVSQGSSATNCDFRDRGATLAGKVYIDQNKNGRFDSGETGVSGVTITLGGASSKTATTDASGNYKFNGLAAGSFRVSRGEVVLPSGTFLTDGQSQIGSLSGVIETNAIGNISVTAGADGTEYNFALVPFDPLRITGVVYNTTTRKAIAGAQVVLAGPTGFDPAQHLVGGSTRLTQTTEATGAYEFDLVPSAPAGDYRVSVTSPANYLAFPSVTLPPCTASLAVQQTPAPANVQSSNIPPALGTPTHTAAACASTSASLAAGAGTTQYYRALILVPGTSASVLNNHIPLDPQGGAILMQKTTPKVTVSKGDLIPYTITATNTLSVALTNVNVVDQMPPGFKYRAGSSTVNGVKVEPLVTGRVLTWTGQNFAAGEKKTYQLVLQVGSGVGDGEYTNLAWAQNTPGTTGSTPAATLSNVADATVRVVPDATFDCTDIIGKVFDDKNANGYQDDGEVGIPNVRLATARGLLMTTDAEGRFHIPCAAVPNADRGSNFVVKLDERTLPSGFRVTTENPRDIRATRGKMSKINFGATVHRVIRVDLSGAAFAPDQTLLLPEWARKFEGLPNILKERPSVVRIAYRRGAEPADLVDARVKALRDDIRKRWEAQSGRYQLIVEEEIEAAK